MAASLKKTDILFAYKALCLIEGLSAAERMVAGAVIDHYNKQTGRCDPSVGRLARLLGLDERSVKRCTARLCGDDVRILTKVSHGGRGYRASYTPNWERLEQIVLDWNARMKVSSSSDDGQKRVTKMSRNGDENVPENGDENVPQTLRKNPLKEPLGAREDNSCRVEAKQGLWRGNEPEGRNQHAKVVYGASPAMAARGAAERRWNAALMDLGESAYADAIERMTVQDQEAATEAEITRRGSGIRVLIERLRAARRDQPDGGRNALH